MSIGDGDGDGAAFGLITTSNGAGLGAGLDMVLSPGVLGSRSPKIYNHEHLNKLLVRILLKTLVEHLTLTGRRRWSSKSFPTGMTNRR